MRTSTRPGSSRPAGARCPIGAHVPVAGGLATGGLSYAAAVGAEVIQVFVSNPRGWAQAAGKATEDARLREHGIPVYVHAPYLINLGSPSEDILTKSMDSLRYTLGRGRDIGALGVVVHTGSAVNWSYQAAMRQIHERLLPLLEELPDDGPDLLLEPMAGQGAMLCATVDQLGAYFDALEHHPRIMVCLDTCHVYAAGHDLVAGGGVEQTVRLLAESVGTGRLKLIHANDSKDPCGSAKDRHENIGAGHIGVSPFAELLRHPLVAGTPFVVETPGRSVDADRANIDILKRLRDT